MHQTQRLYCLDSTQKDLIASIEQFTMSTLNIFWIFGYLRSGKSTLTMYVANLFCIQHHLSIIVEFNYNTDVNAVQVDL